MCWNDIKKIQRVKKSLVFMTNLYSKIRCAFRLKHDQIHIEILYLIIIKTAEKDIDGLIIS